ncbi:MAG: hypothetical protein ACXWAC_16115 [Usitatibacter sp.]
MPISNGKLVSMVAPVTVAVLALSIAVLATGGETSLGEGASAPKGEPTPYSADHSRVQNGPGAPAEQPPTF